MQKIKLLSEEVINKIAAGEVIERPASVVKELIENSLDAGAKYINIELYDAGKKLIRITDDGCGMLPADLELSVQRHATSKISEFSDLAKLQTLGFRGEALSSVASVSRMKIISKTEELPNGWELTLEAGKILTSRECPRSKGTTVEVNDLFFNTPARKKFLKSNTTEQSHTIKAIEELALVHFQTGFTLKTDEKIYITCPPSKKLDDRVIDLLGNRIYGNLINITDEYRLVKIYGFVSKIESSQANKNIQYFFVNSRPVTNRLLTQSLYEAFRDSLPIGRHPMAIILIDTNPQYIDVNVHPTKRIVKFSNEREIYESLSQTIRKYITKQQSPTLPVSEIKIYSVVKESPSHSERYTLTTEQEQKLLGFSEPTESQKENISDEFYVLGQLHDTYALITTPEGLVIIDQHAANERVLYERFLNNNLTKRTQELLVPLTMELAPHECELLKSQMDTFRTLGFEVEEFGLNTIIFKSYPAVLGEVKKLKDFFKVFITLLIDNFSNIDTKSVEPREKIIRSACRAAVKSHDKLSEEEIENIVVELKKCSQPLCCPHGRPTMIRITISELEKKFQRR